MIDVVALGECLIDFTPNGENTQGIALFARNPGGAPANVLAMNACLGGKTAFIGKVGKDGFGDFLRQTLIDSGIDVSGLAVDEKCRRRWRSSSWTQTATALLPFTAAPAQMSC